MSRGAVRLHRRACPVALAALAALAAPPAALAHGDDVPFDDLGGAWTAEPAVVAIAVVVALLFLQGFVRLRRRGRHDHAGWDRLALFSAGLAILLLALLSPLDAAGEEYLLSAHMLQHVLIGDLAPVLMVTAVRGPLLVFLVPAPALRRLARVGWLRAVVRALLHPPVAFALWAATYAVWHVPALYDATLESPALHDLEHGMFVTAGLLVWTALIDPARHRSLRRSQRIGAAVGLFVAGQILADVLLFARSPLYPAYAGQDERLFGWDAMLDQRYAGAVMMVEQALTLGMFLMLLFLAEEQRARGAPAGDGPGAAAEPPAGGDRREPARLGPDEP